MSKQIAKVGDLFWVPLEDDSISLGQIVLISLKQRRKKLNREASNG